MSYQHTWLDGAEVGISPGKVVCVGRNYAEHAKELNNPVPDRPLLFLKPKTSLVSLHDPVVVPRDRGRCHFETEIALLIGETVSQADAEQALAGVLGVGLGLDLTLRDLQNELKDKGHPWEIAKAFDGACPLSRFVSVQDIGAWQSLSLQLLVDQKLQQDGSAAEMVTGIADLLAYMSTHFTLEPGDVVLTGTPKGVGELKAGQQLDLQLMSSLSNEQKTHLAFSTKVI